MPALCTNPDLHRIGPGGRILPGAGALAAHYKGLGGPERLIGKPYADIYRAALALVLCIGDSPAHDIAGTRGMGLASCLVETGVGAPAHQTGPPADLAMRAFAP